MTGLSHERFEALAEAYGADVSRWPAETQDAAALLMAAEPDFTEATLARAAGLDAALDSWRASPASADLAERILSTAPARRRGWRAWLSPVAALGAGLAAACAAGVIVGVQLSSHSSDANEVAVTNTLSAFASYDSGEGA